jgi:radical SAM superfamily enzyme YgiQ (UPF0313 family)
MLVLPPSSHTGLGVPDIGLGYLATALSRNGYEVKIIHWEAERFTEALLRSSLREFCPDVVGAKVFSMNIKQAKKILKIGKEELPRAITVIGGPHPTLVPKHQMLEELPEADFGFCGEAEIGLTRLCSLIQENKTPARDCDIPGLVWRINGTVSWNPPVFVDDLDSFGLPAWDLMPPKRFSGEEAFSFFSNLFPAAPIVATRGCPFRCSFCASPTITGRKLRKRSIDHVISEMKFLKEQHDVRCFYFLDDNLALDRQNFTNLCEAMLAERLNVRWNCPYGIRLGSLDEKILTLMERAGCYSINVGIESGSDRILKHMRKNLSVREIREKCSLIKRLTKINIEGNFILGYPEETEQDILSSIQLACELPISTATFTAFNPIPGTAIFDQLREEKWIGDDINWEGIYVDKIMLPTKHVSIERLEELHALAYRSFYLRPRIALRLLSSMRNATHLKFILRRVHRFASRSKN